jgi:hypothetical protein
VAKTRDRSILGRINDMAFRGSSHVDQEGGLEHANVGAPNPFLRRDISCARTYQRAIDFTSAGW